MKQNKILYLSREDVEKVNLDMPTVLRLVENAFQEKGKGQVEMPPKPGIHTQPDAFIHAMPAYIPAMHAAGIKWVGGYPENYKQGLPYISGLLILNDDITGLPYAVMDCTWITGARTGAATGVAAKYLAQPESESVGILGCGVQGRTNLEALAVLFPIQRVYAYDILPEAQEQYIAEMRSRFDFEFVGVKTPKEAVINSDLVVTAGPILHEPKPTIEKDWLKPGGFGSAVDFDSYWKPEAMAQMDKISTDDVDQFMYYRSIGYFQQTPDPFADLGEIVVGKKPGRDRKDERILAINLGLAIDDMAVAPEIAKRAFDMGIGTMLPL